MLVQKYGGTSVESIEKIKKIAESIKRRFGQKQKLIVVVSAMGKTTDLLTSLANKVCNEPNKREIDQLLSTGESQTIALLSIVLNNIGIRAISLSAFQIGIKTDNIYGGAFIESIDKEKIITYLKNNQVLVVAGFQGVAKNNDITTLGKGGSDTTAVALASVMKCKCEIYTDVSGIFSADPKLVPRAKKLKQISYDELMEMSANGAKVMETRSVEIAKKYKVPLYVGKSLEEKKEGTWVVEKIKNIEFMPIKNITIKDNIGLLEVELQDAKQVPYIIKILSQIQQKLELFLFIEVYDKKIFSCVINENNEKNLIHILKNNKKIINFNVCLNNYCKFSIIGSGFATHSLIAKEIFEELSNENISYKNISINEVSINFLIEKINKQKAIEILTKKFNL